IAALAVLSLWRLEAVPVGLRLVPCSVVAAGAALLAWGACRARPWVAWRLAFLGFARPNYRLRVWCQPRRRRGVVRLRAMTALGKPAGRGAAAASDFTEVA